MFKWNNLNLNQMKNNNLNQKIDNSISLKNIDEILDSKIDIIDNFKYKPWSIQWKINIKNLSFKVNKNTILLLKNKSWTNFLWNYYEFDNNDNNILKLKEDIIVKLRNKEDNWVTRKELLSILNTNKNNSVIKFLLIPEEWLSLKDLIKIDIEYLKNKFIPSYSWDNQTLNYFKDNYKYIIDYLENWFNEKIDNKVKVIKNLNDFLSDDDIWVILETNKRLKNVLLNNKNYWFQDFNDLKNFLKEKIKFWKYAANKIQNFIPQDSISNLNMKINEEFLDNIKNFKWDKNLSDYYDYNEKWIAIKKDFLNTSNNDYLDEIENIIINNEDNKEFWDFIKLFHISRKWLTIEELIAKDPDYLDKYVENYLDYSKHWVKSIPILYYTNRELIYSYLNWELNENNFPFVKKNLLVSTNDIIWNEIRDIKDINLWIINLLKKWFILLDTETTWLDFKNSSLISFWYLDIKYDEINNKFFIEKEEEIFIKDLKKPITNYTSNWDWKKFEWNKITKSIIEEKWLNVVEAYKKIYNILDGRILLAHNMIFDINMLNTFFLDLDKNIPIWEHVLDTMNDIFPKFIRSISKYNEKKWGKASVWKVWLDIIYKKVIWDNISSENERHTALYDARKTFEILNRLIVDFNNELNSWENNNLNQKSLFDNIENNED